jgi:hypothetical protein
VTARSNPFHMTRDHMLNVVRLSFHDEEFCLMTFPQWVDMIAHPTVVYPPEELPEPEEEHLFGLA